MDKLSYDEFEFVALPGSSRATSILIGRFGSGVSCIMSINSCTRLALLAGNTAK